MEKEFFYELVNRYLDGKASQEERHAVETYYEQLADQDIGLLTAKQKVAIKKELYKSIQKSIGVKTKVIPIWTRVAAAAVVAIAIAGTTYLFVNKKQETVNLAALPQTQRFKNDIEPARKGVTLTLADGSKIRLDSAANGKLALQGKTQVIKEDSNLSYEGKTKAAAVLYNTVATAKGQSFNIRLADGTEVWLDAMSSIHFPTAFPGSDREVEITGQAYFEVAHDASKPFRVKSGSQAVEVLGTHFNINAYDPVIKTTLLEGVVIITTANAGAATANSGAQKTMLRPNEQASAKAGGQAGSLKLKPGEQAMVQAGGQITLAKNIDLDEVMAWKNGRFRFDGAGMEEIMKQISRWYDIDVVYKDRIDETFVAKLPRDLPVSRLLNLLEMTRQVAFAIVGNKVTVMKVIK